MIGTPADYQIGTGPLSRESGLAIFAREEACRQIVKRHGYPAAVPLIEGFWRLLDGFATEFGISRLEAPHVALCWYLYLHVEERAKLLLAGQPLPPFPPPLDKR